MVYFRNIVLIHKLYTFQGEPEKTSRKPDYVKVTTNKNKPTNKYNNKSGNVNRIANEKVSLIRMIIPIV